MATEDVLKKALNRGQQENVGELDPKAFEAVVQARRSVRVFTEEPVPEDVVNSCLDMALLAPNSSNLQPWEFYWVRTPAVRRQLVTACLSQSAARTARELVVLVARRQTWRENAKLLLKTMQKIAAENRSPLSESVVKYYEQLVPIVYSQGLLGAVGRVKRLGAWVAGLRTPVPREPFSTADMRVWAVKSSALAAENFMLAASAHGYDTCPLEGYDSRRVARLLSLPADAEIVMVIAMGKRAPKGVYGPRVRLERERFVHEV